MAGVSDFWLLANGFYQNHDKTVHLIKKSTIAVFRKQVGFLSAYLPHCLVSERRRIRRKHSLTNTVDSPPPPWAYSKYSTLPCFSFWTVLLARSFLWSSSFSLYSKLFAIKMDEGMSTTQTSLLNMT